MVPPVCDFILLSPVKPPEVNKQWEHYTELSSTPRALLTHRDPASPLSHLCSDSHTLLGWLSPTVKHLWHEYKTLLGLYYHTLSWLWEKGHWVVTLLLHITKHMTAEGNSGGKCQDHSQGPWLTGLSTWENIACNKVWLNVVYFSMLLSSCLVNSIWDWTRVLQIAGRIYHYLWKKSKARFKRTLRNKIYHKIKQGEWFQDKTCRYQNIVKIVFLYNIPAEAKPNWKVPNRIYIQAFSISGYFEMAYIYSSLDHFIKWFTPVFH